MKHQRAIEVVDKVGRRGTLGEKVDDQQTGSSYTTVRLEDGRSILVLTDLLISREDGTYYVPVDLGELEQQRTQRGTTTQSYETREFAAPNQTRELTANDGEVVLPVIEEELQVGKRLVERGALRVHKHVGEREEVVRELLSQETIEVERVPINRVVEAAEGVREDGDTVIIPVYEEMAVVEKRLVLKEEVRLHVRRSQREWKDRVTLRREEIDIDRRETGEAT